jgi:NADH:ubiquinone oxidoreductase subunit F (NADH-binding)
MITLTRRLLAPDVPADLPRYGPGGLIPVVERAGLLGRGGAGFPTARKLAGVASGRGPAVVVGNAAEGEPASAKDRTLLHHAPHLVLDGLQLAAEAVGADRVCLYAPAAVLPGLREVLAVRRDPLPVGLVAAPERFVAGEESAVVAAVQGRPAVPADKLRPVWQVGVGGRPTLVQNAETLAHLALIARHGPDWFRTCGTADEPGTFLATVDGSVHEFPYGIGLRQVVSGGAPVLVGGYHGAWLPAGADVPVSRAGLRPFGTSPGAGVILTLPAGRCPLRTTAEIVDYLARQTAGQCGPCVNGLPRIATVLGHLAGSARAADGSVGAGGLVVEVTRLSAMVRGRGACHHPDGTLRLVDSALRVFSDEVALHLTGRCAA